MFVELPRDALVIRFRPSNAGDVLRWAEKEHRRRFDPERAEETYYRLSCFADVKRDDETVDDLFRRLIVAAQLAGLEMGKNKNCWVANSGTVQDNGVTFWKDGDAGEVPEHYSFDVGTSPTVERVEQVLSLFEGPERTQAS